MRVAVINLTGGKMSGGYSKYLLNVLPRMATHHEVEALLCASPESVHVQGWFDHFQIPNVKFVNCRAFGFLHPIHDSTLFWQLEDFSPDVMFVPVERSFRFNKVPVVHMLQNMEPFTIGIKGNSIIERIRHQIQYMDGKRAIKGSDRVIALSRFVYDFLIKRWNIPNEKIGLVYHGIDVKKNEDGCKPDIIPEDWHDRFIFTAGSIRPARGLKDLLLAMKHLSLQGEKSVRLIIAGESGSRMAGYQKKLEDWVQKNNLSDRMYWAGGLNEKEMTWCYQNCRLFVITSRVESFGMIAGEAMAHGSVCISANNPCLPEIFGDAAIYYPPKDSKILAEKIQRVLAWGDNQRKAISEKAKKRASEFSWDICAEKTVAVLAKAANNKNR